VSALSDTRSDRVGPRLMAAFLPESLRRSACLRADACGAKPGNKVSPAEQTDKTSAQRTQETAPLSITSHSIHLEKRCSGIYGHRRPSTAQGQDRQGKGGSILYAYSRKTEEKTNFLGGTKSSRPVTFAFNGGPGASSCGSILERWGRRGYVSAMTACPSRSLSPLCRTSTPGWT